MTNPDDPAERAERDAEADPLMQLLRAEPAETAPPWVEVPPEPAAE